MQDCSFGYLSLQDELDNIPGKFILYLRAGIPVYANVGVKNPLNEIIRKNNIGVIIAGAGGSAHLPGMISALTSIPVLGVPIESKKLKGLDSLLSIAQMPKGVPVGTLAIGEDGALNAGLLAASIIANNNNDIKKRLNNWRLKQTKSVKKKPK